MKRIHRMRRTNNRKNKNKNEEKSKYDISDSVNESSGSFQDLFMNKVKSEFGSIKKIKERASKYRKKMQHRKRLGLRKKIKIKEMELKKLKDIEENSNIKNGYGSTEEVRLQTSNDGYESDLEIASTKAIASSSDISEAPIPNDEVMLMVSNSHNHSHNTVNTNITNTKKTIKIILPSQNSPREFIEVINNDKTCCEKLSIEMHRLCFFGNYMNTVDTESNDVMEIVTARERRYLEIMKEIRMQEAAKLENSTGFVQN